MGAIITKTTSTANHEPVKHSSNHNGDRSTNNSKYSHHKSAFNYSSKPHSTNGLTSVICYPEKGYDSEIEQFSNPNGIISMYQPRQSPTKDIDDESSVKPM